MKWQRELPLQLWLENGTAALLFPSDVIPISCTSHPHSRQQPTIPLFSFPYLLCSTFNHPPPSVPDFSLCCSWTKYKTTMFFLHFSLTPSFHPLPPAHPLHQQTALVFHYVPSSFFPVFFLFPLHLLFFIFLLCHCCYVSICLCLPLSSPLPFTPFASDSARQPLSAWLKSSGPTGRAKPWVCFPSERLLFAHSGN